MNSQATIHTARLPSLDEVIGQSAAVERLKVAVAAARADHRSLDHFLMCGPGGSGKTMLAQITAAEIGGRFRETLAQSVNSNGSLAAMLLDASDRDAIFLDEIHLLSDENMTLLYRAMAERKLFIQSSRKQRSLPLAAFTLLAATTDPHHLPSSFRDRFVEVHFDYYTAAELAALLRQRAAAMAWDADDEVFASIAALGRGVPRLALRLLSACREVCRSRNQTVITPEHFESACDLEGLDRELGLNRLERQLLSMLNEAGAMVRLNVLASRLGLSSATVAMHEGYLVRRNLILRTEQGRTLTPDGIECVRRTSSVLSVS
jgi:Holliday junction DNA helicase RuvB